MAARLLADVHLDVQVCRKLRKLGYDIVEARLFRGQKHRNRMSDEALLRYAQQVTRVLITDNTADFKSLNKVFPWHEGIVACPRYDDASAKADAIHRILQRSKLPNGKFTGKWMRIRPESAGNRE
jgi:hypothetical protein